MLFLARIVDGLSGGNISTARAYVADITAPKDRARAYGIIGAAFGLGFILGTGASARVLAPISYTAPIWAAAGITLVAMVDGLVLAARDRAPRADRGTGMPFRERRGDAAAAGPAARPGDRLRVLVRVRGVPDDVRAVRRAALRVRRAADRLLLRRVRGARRRRAGDAHPADGRLARRQADLSGSASPVRRSAWWPPRSPTRCPSSRWRWCRSRLASASVIRRCRAW